MSEKLQLVVLLSLAFVAAIGSVFAFRLPTGYLSGSLAGLAIAALVEVVKAMA